MSNKVFITKYPVDLKNDSLPKLGELELGFDGAGDFVIGGGNTITIKGKGSLVNIADGSNATTVPSDSSKKYAFSGTDDDSRIIVGNKYTMDYVKGSVFPINGLADFKCSNKLRTLYLKRDVQFGGDLSELKNMSSLTILYLTGNAITGDINNLVTLPLTSIQLSRNNIVGDISVLASMTNVTSINLEKTKVTGNVTSIIDNCTKLKEFRIPPTVTITDEQKQILTDRHVAFSQN